MASVMLAVSCVRVQEGMSSLPALPISWRTVETKAASPFPEDRTFISYAWFSLPDGETWSDGSNEPRLYIDGAEISYHDADGWHAGSPFFWPLEGTLSFFSYAPSDMPESDRGGSGVSVTKDGVRLDNWNVLDDDGHGRRPCKGPYGHGGGRRRTYALPPYNDQGPGEHHRRRIIGV